MITSLSSFVVISNNITHLFRVLFLIHEQVAKYVT